MKDSFILYTKYSKQITRLSMEQRGVLFTAILLHESGDPDLPEMDAATGMAFDFIRADLEDNAKKYLEKCAINAMNGAKGGRPKKQPEHPKTEKSERFSKKHSHPKKADNDNDYDYDSKESKEKDTEKEKTALLPASQEIVRYLNDKAGTRYSASSRNTVTMIKGRMEEGHTVDDFKQVIDTKVDEWKGTEQEKYLRPETLFCAKHFESYLNQKPRGKVTKFDRGMMQRTGAEKAANDDLVKQILAMR